MTVRQRGREYAFEFVAFVAVVALLVTEIVLIASVWPDKWTDAAQAALAGALISAFVALASIFVKAIFDRITLETQYRHNVRAKLVESGYVYSCEYLMPLAGSAVELARNIDEYRRADTGPKKERCLEAVLFCLAQYLRVQLGLVGTIPARDSTRPLGLFLTTKRSEDRVWDLMVPPWAFDIRLLDEQGRLVDYEVRRVLSAWYTVEALHEPARLREVGRIPPDTQRKFLGIAYPPRS